MSFLPPSPFGVLKKIDPEKRTGFLLLLATGLALLWANGPENAVPYERFWLSPRLFSLSFGWIVNDVLMTLFFLLIGCELKREALEGELSSLKDMALPLAAAVGGMVLPALCYLGVVSFFFSETTTAGPLHGWAVPTATDIAFALGILSFSKSNLPKGLKTFLMALAVLDDLGAILIICLFYTGLNASLGLLIAAAGLIGLEILRRKKVEQLWPYLALLPLLWEGLHSAGLHATLSGVVLALFLPLETGLLHKKSPLERMEHSLHPIVSSGIMPLFALANAGVSLKGMGSGLAEDPIALAILAGLLIGKPAGVLGASWLAIKLRLARLPRFVTWRHLSGAAALCGIGFTMSLFIGLLAFHTPIELTSVRKGILIGSALSALWGTHLLARAKRGPLWGHSKN